jgi:pyruvate carboxylase subunit A
MFKKVLIANRGEIANRIIRACRDLGVASVAVHSEDDRGASFVRLADEAVEIGPAGAAQSYLDPDRILSAAKETGAEAIHPGYGFLSENAKFAQTCADSGIVFVGPPPAAMVAMGGKIAARDTMRDSGVPIVPGSDALQDLDQAVATAQQIGYPVLIKASAGGGGIGMQVAEGEGELRAKFETAQSTALRAFGDSTIFLEKYVTDPRHIEIQVMADSHGNVVHLGERECSIQRRHQKIIEESPSPVIDDATRERMGNAAVTAAKAVGYVNAGTVEFIYSRGDFYFLEMNTRLQVEHPITELVYGVDLAVEQLQVACGEKLSFAQDQLRRSGHAIECRINAENYAKGFLPSPGRVTGYREPGGPGVRVDSSLSGPGMVSPNYDPMIAKLIVWGGSRGNAIARMQRALLEYAIKGIHTNIPYHLAVLGSQPFRDGDYTTHFIAEHPELVADADEWARRQEPFLAGLGDPARVAAIAAAVAVTT